MAAARERNSSRIGTLMRKASEGLGLAPRPHAARRRAQAPDEEEEEEMGDFTAGRRDLSLCSFRGHQSSVFGCAFAPGAMRILSGGRDKTMRLWTQPEDPGGGRVIAADRVLSGHGGMVLNCDLSPTGRHAVSGCEDCHTRLWAVADGTLAAAVGGHTGKVYAASFSPCSSSCAGALIVTGSMDHTVRVWDTETMKQTTLLSGHTDNVFAARFSADAGCIASGGDDKRVAVWDWRAAKEAYSLRGHQNTVWCTHWSSDGGELLTCGIGAELFVFDTRQRVVKHSAAGVHDNKPTHRACFSLGGGEVLSCGRDKLIQVRENSPGLPLLYSIRGHTGTVYHIDMHPDGDTLLSSSMDSTVRLWSIRAARAAELGG